MDRLRPSASSSSGIQSTDENAAHREYADRVLAKSEQSPATCFLAGDHLVDFHSYLRKGLKDTPDLAAPPGLNLVTLHDFSPDAPSRIRPMETPADVDRLAEENERAKCQAQLLFIRGHIGPHWLLALGSALDIDCEFFYDHISSMGRKWQHGSLSWPPLPSGQSQSPRFRLTTLGRARKIRDKDHTAKRLRKVRERCRSMFDDHIKQVKKNNMRGGTSLVRRYSIHSATSFSFEQDVSFTVKATSKGWVAVAWLDFGDNVADSPAGDQLAAPIDGKPENTVWLSTIHSRGRQGGRTSMADSEVGCRDDGGVQQNVRHLHEQYGQYFDEELARYSSFYAASELFEFTAASEAQFLNMVRGVIKDDIERAINSKGDGAGAISLANLLHNQQVLADHIDRLHDNLLSIETHIDWPRVLLEDSESERDRRCTADVQAKAVQLENDFRCLVRRAEGLSTECDRGVRVVHRIASMEDSKRAYEQAKEVEKLTRLAFVFLPLGFLTGMFGMNFRQFGQGELPLWIFAATAAPVLGRSMLVMSESLRRLGRAQASRMQRLLSREREEGEEEEDAIWGARGEV